MGFARSLPTLFVLLVVAGTLAPAQAAANGSLLLLGGGVEPSTLIDRFAELAGGQSARVLVIGLADPETDRSSSALVEAITRSGVGSVEILPLGPDEISSRATLDSVSQASGIFFADGDPLPLARLLTGTEVARRIESLYLDGRVVAGTGGGAVLLGSEIVVASEPVGAIRQGAVETRPGLGLFSAIVETEFLSQGRQNRLLNAALGSPGRPLGVGLDLGSAILIGSASSFEVLGESLVTVYDLSWGTAPTVDGFGNLAASGITLHLLEPGRSYDLEGRGVKP